MAQLREIRLVGEGKKDAKLRFEAGGNVVSGVSDTGKSFVVRCIDFALGKKTFTKVIDEAQGYEKLLLEFENGGAHLTIARALTGGDIAVYHQSIDKLSGEGQAVPSERRKNSTESDITWHLLSFFGMPEASLRKNKDGAKQRLTIRTLLPLFLVDENSIIAERSPAFGESGYAETAQKRQLSFVLTGVDDEAVITQEKREIAKGKIKAKLSLIEQLLEPITLRLAEANAQWPVRPTMDHVIAAISELSGLLEADREHRFALREELAENSELLTRTQSQAIALNELLVRYELLDERYASDLQRLDFIAEGSHYFKELETVDCPLCEQPLTATHKHTIAESADANSVYEAARVEAAKINALRNDLVAAIKSLNERRSARADEKAKLETIITRVTLDIESEGPELKAARAKLDELVKQRIELEAIKSDEGRAAELRTLQTQFEQELKKPSSVPKDWAALNSKALNEFCTTVEKLLDEWGWRGEGRVTFDEKAFDIVVDGKARQAHGKGVRAILYSAFAIALMRYCLSNRRPHPGFVILDSPLTTYKEKRDGAQLSEEDKLNPGIETAFWVSLANTVETQQVIMFDNKQPPETLIDQINYEWFGGADAEPNERRGFIP